MLDGNHKDLSVADGAGLSCALNGFDDACGELILHDQLDPHLGDEVRLVFGAAIDFGVPLLPAVTLRFGDGQSLNGNSIQGSAHVIELVRFDDRKHQFHYASPQKATPKEA